MIWLPFSLAVARTSETAVFSLGFMALYHVSVVQYVEPPFRIRCWKWPTSVQDSIPANPDWHFSYHKCESLSKIDATIKSIVIDLYTPYGVYKIYGIVKLETSRVSIFCSLTDYIVSGYSLLCLSYTGKQSVSQNYLTSL